MIKLLPGLAEAERVALGARLDARAMIAAARERVAAVLSVLDESGVGRRRADSG